MERFLFISAILGLLYIIGGLVSEQSACAPSPPPPANGEKLQRITPRSEGAYSYFSDPAQSFVTEEKEDKCYPAYGAGRESIGEICVSRDGSLWLDRK